jgi:ankyrin repeat protein
MKHQRNFSSQQVITALILFAIMMIAACSKNKGGMQPPQGGAQSQQKPEQPKTGLHAAVLMGDVKSIEQHIKAGTDLNLAEPSVGSSPLITAAVFGKVEAAKLLVAAGANVNFQNKQGSTPLHCAAFLCHKEIVQILLDHGADKDIRNNYGSTALESVAGPFDQVRGVYDQFSKDLGPLGFKLDYNDVQKTRPVIANMLKSQS